MPHADLLSAPKKRKATKVIKAGAPARVGTAGASVVAKKVAKKIVSSKKVAPLKLPVDVNDLKVAKAVKGPAALRLLIDAGIFTRGGKARPRFR